ncbi:MAG: ShlB/FhaC/HecB family hemolysin secretion/activation protein [Gemmatimonadota bacterium]|nr:ShlB/FhaC/HecB family hemolysin secretion/activation protein [Gemmatimonadota bacterium]
MLIAPALLILALQAPALPPDSYADSATAALVTRARAARDRNERLVTSYSATVSQRIGVGVRALSRDRMLYRQEVAARISWNRDSRSTIEVTGLREAVPVASRTDALPSNIPSEVRGLVVNPAEDYLFVLGNDAEGFVYPLATGGEVHYRYATGDSTRIELPSGSVIRLIELRVTPRRADWRLVSGSLWFDADSYGLVRAVFRPARPYEYRRDSDPDDREDVPSFVNGTGELKHITMEYGLYENRWWMLRYVALEGVGTVGKWMNVPVRFERVYSEYEVEGGSPRPEGLEYRPAGTRQRVARDTTPAGRERRIDVDTAAMTRVQECLRQRRAAPDSASTDSSSALVELEHSCSRLVRGDTSLAVVVPRDRESLLTSPTLGPPILSMGDLITEDELRGVASAIRNLPTPPLDRRLELPQGLGALLQHARYNRVEALSLGVRAAASRGRFEVDALGRIGIGDLVPNAELGVGHAGTGATWRLGGYRRLEVANPDSRALAAVNSLSALLLQRDDGEYFRTTGGELRGQATQGGWLTWRLYAERQSPALRETNASLPRLFSTAQVFRPNFTADSADQVGASVGVRSGTPISRTVWLGGDAQLDAATGDYEFGRGAAALRLVITPERRWAVALEGAAGTSRGAVPTQSRFYLGGPANLRGYAGGVMAGESFWRVRAEVGNAFPAARLTLFSDAGWAGPRADFTSGKPLLGVGVGASFLDGLVRMDLARAMRGVTGWRFDIYFDGRL